MSNIAIGTASWTDKTLIECGRYYPSDVKTPEQRLRFYAAEFPMVELDSSYYAIPSVQNAKAWVERTPEHFTFDVKAFRLLTQHQTAPKVLPKYVTESLPHDKKTVYYRDLPEELRRAVWDEFRTALAPLKEAGKLGVVLFQFPKWFLPNKESRAYIADCVERMNGFRLAVEFRHQLWFNESGHARTLAFLRELGLAHVVVDEPQGFTSSVPAIWEATSPDIAVVRFHGRNRETWEARGLAAASDRFDYYYSEEELKALAEPLEALSKQVGTVHAVFNTNRHDQGPVNARMLKKVLQAAAS